MPTAQVRRNTKRLFNFNTGIFSKSWDEKKQFPELKNKLLLEKVHLLIYFKRERSKKW